jgi:hypothetical protein
MKTAIAEPEKCSGSGKKWVSTGGAVRRVCSVCHQSSETIAKKTGRTGTGGTVPSHEQRGK